MKVLFSVVLLLIVTTTLQGQTLVSPDTTLAKPVSPVLIQLPPLVKVLVPGRGRRMRNTGIVMTSVGSVLQGLGLIWYKQGYDEVKAHEAWEDASGIHDPDLSIGVIKKLRGVIVFGTGTALACPGTVLWIAGARRIDLENRQRKQMLGFRLGVAPAIYFRF